MQGAALPTEARAACSQGGPVRPWSPLTVVMHGCPHKAAVGLGQGLIGRVLTRKVWRGLGVLDSSVLVCRSGAPGGWHETRNVATTVPCKACGASQNPARAHSRARAPQVDQVCAVRAGSGSD